MIKKLRKLFKRLFSKRTYISYQKCGDNSRSIKIVNSKKFDTINITQECGDNCEQTVIIK